MRKKFKGSRGNGNVVIEIIQNIFYKITSIFYGKGGGFKKPIIYFYPEDDMELTVKLGKSEKVIVSYPEYEDSGWNVIAKPNGDLIDLKTNRNLYALYYESIIDDVKVEEDGFVVKGDNVIYFLEEKLKILGLTEREAEEFIVYWLPILQNNEYNYIRFVPKEEIDKVMPLEFSKTPDSLIRVMMVYKPLNKVINVREQKLDSPKRCGFVVVEWGGVRIK